MSNKSVSYLACIMAIVFWGSAGIFVKVIGAGAMTLVFMDAIVGLVCLLPVAIIRGGLRGLLNRRAMLGVALAGLFGTLTPTLYSMAVQSTTVTNAVLAHQTIPLFVILLAPLLIGEQRQRGVLLAIPVGMLGIAAIMPFDDLTFGSNDLVGILIGVVSAITFALQLLTMRKFSSSLPAYTMAAAICAITIVLLGPIVLTQPDQMAMVRTMPFWFILKGIMTNAIPMLLYVWSLKAIEAQRVSVIGFLEPLSAIVLAMIFLNEAPGFSTLIGGALILGAGYWVISRGPQPATPQEVVVET